MSTLNTLDAQKRALLQKLMQQKAAAASSEIPRAHSEGPIPLSFGQQRLWFLDQMQPGSSGYNLHLAYRMSGALNVQALQAALQTVIDRQGSLRTTFPTLQGTPVQAVAEKLAFDMEQVDLREVAESTREAHLQKEMAERGGVPFDLASGPLLRATLYRVEEQEHVLLLTIHHIISDGWSNGVLVRELGQAYGAWCNGQAPQLPELGIQFTDVTIWQQQRFANGGMESDLSYWTERLKGAPTLTELPLDFPRPAVQGTEGRTLSFRIGAPEFQAFLTMCRQEGVTMIMGLMALFKTLLYRYSGQDDLLVGVPVLNRQRKETEPLIGFFTNTLAIRTSLAENLSFRELLQRVRQSTVGAYEHQEMPFEKLVEVLQPERNTSHAPLVQVMMMVSAGGEAAKQQIEWEGGLQLTSCDVDRDDTIFDLALQVEQQGDELALGFQYRVDLFEAATIARMAGHLQRLLAGAAAAPERALSELPLLTEVERHQLVVEWNATEVDFGEVHVLHHLVERQVERTPDRIAVRFADESLTYRELNERANQLAHHLRGQGVGPDVLVGIAADRSLEMVVGLLGILKSGGAYVPLDPSYPIERLAYMLTDSNVPILLTQAHLLAGLPTHQAQVICLDRDWPSIAKMNKTNPEGLVTPDHLAYMIYTSGSTGKPKGALNRHRGISNRLLWMQNEYRLSAEDRVLQKTPFSFDVSVWEFFWPLLTGASLVLAKPEGHKDAAYLAELIRQEGITTLHFVPSMLRLFLAEPQASACDSVRRVMCSGEALPLDLQALFFERLQADLHNLYGPTEAAVDVTYHACERDSERRSVPIGRPVANTQMYVLDRHLQPVPIGVPGELHIGGVQVGAGYLNRPELTAEKFIADPFRGEPGARLYKTGDLACLRADGTIEYLGRLDHQVKLRGLRIELGEIEERLLEHPQVGAAVVVAHEYAPGDVRLVAYWTAKAAEGPDVAELRYFLSITLPEYMVPGQFLALEQMPLSPNGKIDRKALPSPESVQQRESAPLVLPKNEVERAIAEIWKAILRLPQVGTRDHFFEIGGHSLLVPQVRQQLNEHLGADLSILDMFRYTTIQALAEQVRKSQSLSAAPGKDRPQPPKAAAQAVQDRAAKQREAMKKRNRERR